jgi:hypothetical protein
MSKKKKWEYRERNDRFEPDKVDGLKQRRLKDESRWRFNPNQTYESDEDLEEENDDAWGWQDDSEFDRQ